MTPCDVVLLSTADWDNPFWTNKQHVACGLAARGFRVLYIESLGLRRPAPTAADLSRIRRRLRKAAARPRLVRENLWVWSPLVLPFQRFALVRALNRALLTAALAWRIRRLGLRRPWLWTYNPLTAQLLRLAEFERVVYHCVDDIAAQPGMPAAVLEQCERDLVRHADVVFTTAPRLQQTRRRWNPNTHYLPNVADFGHFSKALDEALPIPADLANVPRPRLGFIGALSGYKVDFGLVRHLALSRPDWSIVLIGRIGEGDPWTDTSGLLDLPNVHLLGPRPYAELPAYLKAFDVALLPSARNAYTDSMFPMKFFEYLAAGKPVVSVDLPALREFDSAVWLAESADDFRSAVEAVLDGAAPPLESRLALARRYTYDARLARMLELLDRPAPSGPADTRDGYADGDPPREREGRAA